MSAEAIAPHPSGVLRRVARVAGDFLLGISVGLLSYYALTGLVAGLGQRSLDAEMRDLGALGAGAPADLVVSAEDEPLDFEGWTEQDRAYWVALPQGGIFGRLVSEGMRLDAAVTKGATPATLKRGPGWIDYTDLPGPVGNVGISGHRTTYGAPFRRLDALKPGDVVDFYSPFRRYRYTVSRTLIVTPDRVDVVGHTEEPMLTLTACHPPYSARYRLIVQAELTEVSRLREPGVETAPR